MHVQRRTSHALIVPPRLPALGRVSAAAAVKKRAPAAFAVFLAAFAVFSAAFAVFLAALAVVSSLPTASRAAEACTEAQLQRVQDDYGKLSAFRAKFLQEDREVGGTVRTAQGEVAYRRPGHMRWRYDPPHEQLLVTDGKTVWLYDPLLDNVTVQELDEVTQGTPLAFLLGAGDLARDFACRAPTREPPDDELTYLELVPRQPIPALEFLQIGVRQGQAAIASLLMVDAQGNSRWVRFLEMDTGPDLPEDYFTFKITPDMEVIRRTER